MDKIIVGQRYRNTYTCNIYKVIAIRGLYVEVENESNGIKKTFHRSNILNTACFTSTNSK